MMDVKDAIPEQAQYKLDDPTFDMLNDNKSFQNYRSKTVFWYICAWVLMVLSWALLASDVYTCLNILVFHKWDNSKNPLDYKPYAYNVAKWIFTGCIIFEIVLLLYHWIWAIKAYKSKDIARIYLNPIARLMYTIKSYNYFCLFHEIDLDNFFDWSCFYILDEFDSALQILVADTPRQVINILTLKYYATDGSIDILKNIQTIYTTNARLGVILAFMLFSLLVWCIFIFRFALAIILYLPIYYQLRTEKSYKSLKKYCRIIVVKLVRACVFKNKASLNEYYFERNERSFTEQVDVKANPYTLTNISLATLHGQDDLDGPVKPRGYRNDSMSSLLYSQSRNPSLSQFEHASTRKASFPLQQAKEIEEYLVFNSRSTSIPTNPFEENKPDHTRAFYSSDNPFDDSKKILNKPRRKPPSDNPFADYDSGGASKCQLRNVSVSDQPLLRSFSLELTIADPRFPARKESRLNLEQIHTSPPFPPRPDPILSQRPGPPLPPRPVDLSTSVQSLKEYNPEITYDAPGPYISSAPSKATTKEASSSYLSSKVQGMNENEVPYPQRGISVFDDDYNYTDIEKFGKQPKRM